MDKTTIIPKVELWCGNGDHFTTEVQRYLQNLYCAENGCTLCSTCRHIKEKQFHAIRWITPTDGYTIADLEPIFTEIAFEARSARQFFIVDRVELLTDACINKLLKILEDAPPGYHFLLCATRDDLVAQTIRSRSLVRFFQHTSTPTSHPFYQTFCSETPCTVAQLNTLIDVCKEMNKTEFMNTVEHLIIYWTTRVDELKQGMKRPDAIHRVQFLSQHFNLLNNSTNTTLFLRALYLQWFFLSSTH